MIRDIKPDNIMLTKRDGGHAKMIDFGCGCVGLERKGLTFLHIIGTPGYTAPEMVKAKIASDLGEMAGKTDEAMDLFAFGVLMWATLTGGLALPKEVGVSQQ